MVSFEVEYFIFCGENRYYIYVSSGIIVCDNSFTSGTDKNVLRGFLFVT